MILPSKVILTENEVLEAVGLSRFKSAVHHDELFIHGKSVINFGIDDLIEDVEYDLQVMKDEDRTSFGALEAKYANVPLVLHILPTTTTLEVINDKISWRDS
jgi:hypothetical protein